MTVDEALKNISLTCANFGNAAAFARVLEDWFEFLGGKPGEVIVVDGGSDAATREVYWKLLGDAKIDKLQVIRPEHADNSKETCYIQEHTSGAIASKPYLLFFKSDTLPFRKGHGDWIVEAIGYLDRDDTMGVGGSFNLPSKHHEAWPGWYFSDKCSINFVLMKRDTFIAAMQEFAGDYLASGFRGTHPMTGVSNPRYLIEYAFAKYIEKHQKYVLARLEDASWTVFHTNVLGEKLVKVREDYVARKGVEKYMNAGRHNRIYNGTFYGRPAVRWKRFKWTVGESALGPMWRRMKRALGWC